MNMKIERQNNKTQRTNQRIKDSDYTILDKVNIDKDKPKYIYNNPFQINEFIVRSIIDKIIAISVRASCMKNFDKDFEDYCNNYVLTQLNSLLATKYLYYYKEPENEDSNILFWNKSFIEKNTWIEIKEPISPQIDRYENVFVKCINYDPSFTENDWTINMINRTNTLKKNNPTPIDKKELMDIKMRINSNKKYSLKIKKIINKEEQNKILDILEEKSSISSKDEETKNKKSKRISKLSKNFDNPLYNIYKSHKEIISLRKVPSQNPKPTTTQNDLNTEIDNDNIETNFAINKNSKRQPILPIDCKDIPGIEKEFNFDKYSPPDVDKLRKKMKEEKIKKENEEKKKALIKSLTINNGNGDNNEIRLRIIDSNKLTFDSNGTLIRYKPFKIETLSKDFLSTKNEIRVLNNNDNSKKDINEKIRTISSKEEQKKISPKEEEENKTITKNPKDDPNGEDKVNYVKIPGNRTEKIIPSGSNFSIMFPNIGVTLKEDDKIKEGTRDFGMYFKKYSISDYDRILRDYLPIQNKTMLKNKMGQSKYSTTTNMNLTSLTKRVPKNSLNINTIYKYSSTSLNKNNNTIDFNMKILPLTQTQNFNTDLTNPLINPQELIQESDTNNINNNSSIKTNKSKISYVFSGSNLYTMRKMNNNSNYREGRLIKLSRNCSSFSLKNEIENMKDLNVGNKFNFYSPKIKLKSRNILNNFKEIYKIKRKNEFKDNTNVGKKMNELNKKIIMAGEWGNHSLQKNKSTGNLLFSKHATKYQSLRELGSNLFNGIKVKLPRERKVDIHI